jgi:hypothetical protein
MFVIYLSFDSNMAVMRYFPNIYWYKKDTKLSLDIFLIIEKEFEA